MGHYSLLQKLRSAQLGLIYKWWCWQQCQHCFVDVITKTFNCWVIARKSDDQAIVNVQFQYLARDHRTQGI